ncbi:MAG: glutamine-hydrolyzing GMP synthase [Saprospiraceae bacterium]|nr:glutamine-hydrolyzing GMP synthase [Saprospiraceae bacterium]
MEKIVVFDFGSQYTQLIGRRLREIGVFSEIIPFHASLKLDNSIKGIVLSGSPASVLEEAAPQFPIDAFIGKVPILAVCYGAQYIAQQLGGKVERSQKREYGRALLSNVQTSGIFEGIAEGSQVWMSHGDTILQLPEAAASIASTHDIPIAAYEINGQQQPVTALQFHPEVYHSSDGLTMLKNWAFNICNCSGNWTPAAFVDSTVQQLKSTIGSDNVVLGLSGGVDSSVAALLLHKAIGQQLHCIFVDNGLLRKNEFHDVLESYKDLGLNVKGVDASEHFLSELKGISDPEKKRKTIGRVFIEVFEAEANAIDNVKWLAQGTIYPDVIESVSVYGPSVTIKSHHNVGGLPEKLNLKIVEPLNKIFKDEVRRVGAELDLPKDILHRHPFPGPGLAIRILGDITPDNVRLLQEADHIYTSSLKETGLYDKIWQAGAILLPIKSVGVMGDERTYEQVVALRAVTSTDGMTADWYDFPTSFLRKVSNDIINQVKGINRVVYDISSKPPATIEWE